MKLTEADQVATCQSQGASQRTAPPRGPTRLHRGMRKRALAFADSTNRPFSSILAEIGVDLARPEPTLDAFRMTNTPETKSRSLSPDEIPFHNTQSFGRYTTDTGKLLPRKYTRMSAKQQRRVTKTIKRARNIHLMP